MWHSETLHLRASANLGLDSAHSSATRFRLQEQLHQDFVIVDIVDQKLP
jgi:hypothetical protein